MQVRRCCSVFQAIAGGGKEQLKALEVERGAGGVQGKRPAEAAAQPGPSAAGSPETGWQVLPLLQAGVTSQLAVHRC